MPDELYPKEFLRGISSKDYIDNGHVLYSAFQFKDTGRDDGNSEASINWLDDDDAITIALNQRKENGKIKKHGIKAEVMEDIMNKNNKSKKCCKTGGVE